MLPLLRYLIVLLCTVVLCPLSAQTPTQSLSDSAFFQSLTYRSVGPTRGGRVTAVSGITAQPGTFLMGSTGGGVWKTADYGLTWHNLSDGYFASPSIGAISVFQPNPDIIYVGTGSDGIRSNIIAGKGVYKSTNGGKAWESVGLEQAGLIGAVEIHPEHPDTVLVAAIGQPFQPNAQRGVFRTYDGGRTWDQVLYHSDTIGAVDLEFAPDNPEIIYAALWRTERKPWTVISGAQGEGGIYKSTDGGDTWKKLNRGLPQGLIGKIDLAVSPADPQRLYALVEAPGEEGGLYRSDNQGNHFELISTHDGLLDRPFYYCNIVANPLDADVVFALATRCFKSTDGGKHWKTVATPHGDNHDLWFYEPDTSVFIQANDGGVNVTTNGGKTWSTQHNQPTAELYQIEVDDQYPYWVYAGQQDNTTIAVPSLPPHETPAGAEGYWMSVGGCETGPAVPKPGEPNTVYANCKGRFGVYNKLTGQEQQYYVGAQYIYGHNPKDLEFRFQRVSPVYVSKHNPEVVYFGSQFLHRTRDDGQTWETISPDLTANDPTKQVVSGEPITRDVTGEEYYSTLYEITESPLKEGLLWTGANDGPIHVSRDGGDHWQDVTPQELPEGGRVDCIEPSAHQEGRAYAAILRYQLGDWHPYIYKTDDYGQHWTLLTDGANGIPEDMPVRVVREDPDVEGILYAGTEYGMYISLNNGKTWQPFQQNLPVTPVTDIKVFRKDLVVSTMGRSFWILDNLSPLHQRVAETQSGEVTLYEPRDAYRYRYRGNEKEEVPYYPDPAVTIDYVLAEEVEGEVTLKILDASDSLIRAYRASDHSQGTEESQSMATGFFSGGAKLGLQKTRGLHRFQWDMTHRGPWDADPDKRYSRGPLVSPGSYQAQLTVNDKTYLQTFELLPDPRLEVTGVTAEDIQAQEALVLKVVDLESAAKQAAQQIEQKTELLKENAQKNQQPLEALQQLYRQLETAEGAYRQPMLIDQVSYLRSMLQQADQRPGKDAYARYDALYRAWQDIEASLANYDLERISDVDED